MLHKGSNLRSQGLTSPRSPLPDPQRQRLPTAPPEPRVRARGPAPCPRDPESWPGAPLRVPGSVPRCPLPPPSPWAQPWREVFVSLGPHNALAFHSHLGGQVLVNDLPASPARPWCPDLGRVRGLLSSVPARSPSCPRRVRHTLCPGFRSRRRGCSHSGPLAVGPTQGLERQVCWEAVLGTGGGPAKGSLAGE